MRHVSITQTILDAEIVFEVLARYGDTPASHVWHRVWQGKSSLTTASFMPVHSEQFRIMQRARHAETDADVEAIRVEYANVDGGVA